MNSVATYPKPLCMEKIDLVLLHGWGLSAERLTPLTRELKQRGFSVFTPDLPGFGKTKTPDHPLNLVDYTVFLKKYLQQNNIHHPVLIGHSFGGRVAIKFQNMYPNIVRALILSGTPGFTPVSKRKIVLAIFLAKLGKVLFLLPPLSFFADRVRKWYYYFVGAKEFYQAQGAMRETFKRIVQEQLSEQMQSITVPCLLLWGKEDIIVPVSVAKRMTRVISGSKLEIIGGADHGLPYKQPKIFVAAVSNFLRDL